MIGIYKITSPSNKVYIGQSVNIENRKKNYTNFKTNKNNIGPKMYNSLQKHGWEQHIFEIIEECCLDQLNEREIYWGEHYCSLEEGLNCKLGDGRGHCCEETKQKISLAKTGMEYKMTEEGRKNKSKLLTGLKRSEETKKKISQAKQGHECYSNPERSKNLRKNSPFKKEITQFSLNGEKIQTFPSAKEACRYLGKSNNSIADCASGRQKTAYGYVWKYKIDIESYE
jgi:group I intron endonuclease